MELFELKYTEEIYQLYSKIQALLNHYLVEHKELQYIDMFNIIEKHTEIQDGINDESDEDFIETELY